MLKPANAQLTTYNAGILTVSVPRIINATTSMNNNKMFCANNNQTNDVVGTNFCFGET